MDGADGEEALTAHAAATVLGTSPNRVYQLLREGRLTGPSLPDSRLRALPGTKRVWKSSLDSEVQRRSAARANDVPTARPQPSRLEEQPATSAESASMLTAVHEMKVRLDLAREELRRERRRSAHLARLLADTTQLVSESIAREDSIDDLADGYSEALSQLLSPDDPGGTRDRTDPTASPGLHNHAT